MKVKIYLIYTVFIRSWITGKWFPFDHIFVWFVYWECKLLNVLVIIGQIIKHCILLVLLTNTYKMTLLKKKLNFYYPKLIHEAIHKMQPKSWSYFCGKHKRVVQCLKNRRTNRKVKTEGPSIMYIDILYLKLWSLQVQ